MTFSRNDLVLLPIPFSDLTSSKVRPAVVVGMAPHHGDLFLAPITSRVTQGEFALKGWRSCGLNVPSAVKGQLATVESKLVRKNVGKLSEADAETLDRHLRGWLELDR